MLCVLYSPQPGPPGGELESQFFPWGWAICVFTFSSALSPVCFHGHKPPKTPVIRLMHIPNFMFLINPSLRAPSWTEKKWGQSCRRFSPVRGLILSCLSSHPLEELASVVLPQSPHHPPAVHLGLPPSTPGKVPAISPIPEMGYRYGLRYRYRYRPVPPLLPLTAWAR